jgi:hypothetical protein
VRLWRFLCSVGRLTLTGARIPHIPFLPGLRTASIFILCIKLPPQISEEIVRLSDSRDTTISSLMAASREAEVISNKERKIESMEIVGKRLALVIWGKDRNGEDEVWVHAGTVQASGSGFVLDRGEDKPLVKLLPEWFPRIKPVNDEVRSTLHGAEICVSLTLSPIPEGMDPSEFEDIGLHHPPDK